MASALDLLGPKTEIWIILHICKDLGIVYIFLFSNSVLSTHIVPISFCFSILKYTCHNKTYVGPFINFSFLAFCCCLQKKYPDINTYLFTRQQRRNSKKHIFKNQYYSQDINRVNQYTTVCTLGVSPSLVSRYCEVDSFLGYFRTFKLKISEGSDQN